LASMSDIGCQRENNEDQLAYWEPADDDEFARKGRLAVVADGMGGHEGGQEASRIAVASIILEYAAGHPELHGMGTTATAIVLLGNQLYYAHVGDSRLYLVRGATISRLTHDHSYVGRLVQNGVISAEEAETHPQRHILTAALGAGTEISPEIPQHPVPLQKGDVLILCTDGLWSLLSDHEIQGIVTSNDPAEASRALIKLAKDRGGPDNITVQVLRLTEGV
jgi:serine/threonine protein phosphatase PrpC